MVGGVKSGHAAHHRSGSSSADRTCYSFALVGRFEGAACENDKELYKYGDMDEMAQIGLMLMLIYVLTLIFRVVHADLLGGVLAGFILLPVADWVVHEEAIQTVGRIGVSLLSVTLFAPLFFLSVRTVSPFSRFALRHLFRSIPSLLSFVLTAMYTVRSHVAQIIPPDSQLRRHLGLVWCFLFFIRIPFGLRARRQVD